MLVDTEAQRLRADVVACYFRELRLEINQRITAHTTLVTAKIVTAGALAGFLLTQLPDRDADIRYVGLLVVPMVAALYDLLIAKNVKVIHELGIHIREVLEPEMRRHADVCLWEEWHNAGDHEGRVKTRNFGRFDIVMLVLFTLATGVVAVAVLWARRYEEWAIPAAAFFAAGSIALSLTMDYLMVRKAEFGPPKAKSAD